MRLTEELPALEIRAKDNTGKVRCTLVLYQCPAGTVDAPPG